MIKNLVWDENKEIAQSPLGNFIIGKAAIVCKAGIIQSNTYAVQDFKNEIILVKNVNSHEQIISLVESSYNEIINHCIEKYENTEKKAEEIETELNPVI